MSRGNVITVVVGSGRKIRTQQFVIHADYQPQMGVVVCAPHTGRVLRSIDPRAICAVMEA